MTKILDEPERVRVLCLSRLFSGLKSALAADKWEPAGVPAICRLIEGLAADREVDLQTVFCLKEPDTRFTQVSRRTLAPIGERIVLPYQTWFGLCRR
ncbi:MAG: hypothetical protein P8Y71_27595, partial [Pseudolabrys sp.]